MEEFDWAVDIKEAFVHKENDTFDPHLFCECLDVVYELPSGQVGQFKIFKESRIKRYLDNPTYAQTTTTNYGDYNLMDYTTTDKFYRYEDDWL